MYMRTDLKMCGGGLMRRIQAGKSGQTDCGGTEEVKYGRKGRGQIFPLLRDFEAIDEPARIFGQINLLYIWSSELISVYKKVISITGDLNTLSGRVNINLRL
eukprot:TRINITY_DN340_c1_g1_i5.p22 TRINITY_DN340_c1_g1~~TRINITY_DN340_c1_g1_i5.p22  ORF type:complete len:102 (-),score=0.18 TRINITY_DN340_c1_g1_i5:6418-6723(-)